LGRTETSWIWRLPAAIKVAEREIFAAEDASQPALFASGFLPASPLTAFAPARKIAIRVFRPNRRGLKFARTSRDARDRPILQCAGVKVHDSRQSSDAARPWDARSADLSTSNDD
jgi:hypothetical protein